MPGGAKQRLWSRAARAVVQYPSLDAAAAAVGIGTSTLDRWLCKDEFRTEVRRIRSEIEDDAKASLRDALTEAVAALRDGMTERIRVLQEIAATSKSDAARVSAIRASNEMLNDLEDRISLQAELDALRAALDL